ncbi:tetratricopeptide repeat protein [Dyella sp. 20L07]|uniref:tetratricopeptide repeat protein n=1 Tax=Dyella sp. 20L07 TaxID=3384240 RepID=UPI003D28A5D1
MITSLLSPLRNRRTVSTCIDGRWLLTLASCMMLAACGKTLGGYPNRAAEPTLVGPSTPSPDDKVTYLDLIRQMQQQGAYYASLAHIDAYRMRYGNPPELRRLQADALRETKQFDAARDLYQNLTSTNQAAAAWHGLGLIAATTGQNELAEQHLQKAVELEPVNAAYLSDLGYARLCAGKIAGAREPLAKAAELDPTDAKVISNLSLWALLNGDNVQANAIMDRANLPQAARDSVRRLAIELQAAKRVAVVARSTQPHPTPSDTPEQMASFPGSMLDRFGPATATNEARP